MSIELTVMGLFSFVQATHILLHVFNNIEPSYKVEVFAYALNSHQDEWTHKVNHQYSKPAQ